MTFWLLIFRTGEASVSRKRCRDRANSPRAENKSRIDETSKEHKREQLLGTSVVKRGKHTSKELTVIRPPEKQLVAWPRREELETTRDVILASTAESSCSPAPTRSHFAFLFIRETEKKRTANLEVSFRAVESHSTRDFQTRVNLYTRNHGSLNDTQCTLRYNYPHCSN